MRLGDAAGLKPCVIKFSPDPMHSFDAVSHREPKKEAIRSSSRNYLYDIVRNIFRVCYGYEMLTVYRIDRLNSPVAPVAAPLC